MTPGCFSALEPSSLTMRAWGTVLRKSLVCSIRGSMISSAYFVAPVHLEVASTLRKGFPTTRRPVPRAPLLPPIDALLRGFGRLASHPGGRQFHRLVYLDIAGAAANISGKSRL